jgi:hypothetical protein
MKIEAEGRKSYMEVRFSGGSVSAFSGMRWPFADSASRDS